jgi:putative ABC transport system permease protein
MSWWETLLTSLRSLRINLGRSILTMLGIIIGVAAIVLVVAFGQAAKTLILGEVEGIGANTVIVVPGREPQGPTDVAGTILGDSLKARDVEALKRSENVPGVEFIGPAVIDSSSVSYQDNTFHPLVFGWSGEALERMFQIMPEEGAYFTSEDIAQHAKVAVIGWRVKDELFGESSAVGEAITIHNQKVRVVGILPKRGQISTFNIDEIVLLPVTTVQKDILNINFFHRIFIQIAKNQDIDAAVANIKATLRELHGITDPKKDDFFILTQADIVQRISTVTRVLTVFLGAIASVALVVGGIGIMNIMLVSVTERTREIGLRKSLGATTSDILRQFLLEALLLTISGGLLGTAIAITLAALTTVIVRQQFGLAWPYVIPTGAILLGVGMAAAVGLVFGLYPARQAARKSPIEALRYE